MNRDDRFDLGTFRKVIVFTNSYRAGDEPIYATMSEALAHARKLGRAARVVAHGDFFKVEVRDA